MQRGLKFFRSDRAKIVLCIALFLSFQGWISLQASANWSATDLTPSELSHSNIEQRPELVAIEKKIEKGIERISEIQVIREFAKLHGRRAFLFGGTASTVAIHILQNKDPHQESSSWSLSNIFRETQDLDILWDGPVHEAIELEEELNQRFPYRHRRDPLDTSSTPAWEVRPLRENIGPKPYLIDSHDHVEAGFLAQNTDTLSTGLIEITEPPSGKHRITDLRFYDGGPKQLAQIDPEKSPNFLGDLFRKRITLIVSPHHMGTKMARKGKNPEIFGVLRTLTKVAQTGFDLDSRTLTDIQEILNRFNPTRDLANSIAKTKIIQQTRKMMASATYPRQMLELLNEIQDRNGISLKTHLMRLDPQPYSGSLNSIFMDQSNPLTLTPMLDEIISPQASASCMSTFTHLDTVSHVLVIENPIERVAHIKKLSWSSLSEIEKEAILKYAPQTINSYERGAFIEMAEHSLDERWISILKGWIQEWKRFSSGWQAKLRSQADESLGRLKTSIRRSND